MGFFPFLFCFCFCFVLLDSLRWVMFEKEAVF